MSYKIKVNLLLTLASFWKVATPFGWCHQPNMFYWRVITPDESASELGYQHISLHVLVQKQQVCRLLAAANITNFCLG